MTAPKTADLGAPPPKPSVRDLGQPPAAEAPPAAPEKPKRVHRLGQPPHKGQTKGNITKKETVQLNVEVPYDRHKEIKMAALVEDMSLINYVLMCHDIYQESKAGERKRA